MQRGAYFEEIWLNQETQWPKKLGIQHEGLLGLGSSINALEWQD